VAGTIRQGDVRVRLGQPFQYGLEDDFVDLGQFGVDDPVAFREFTGFV